MPTTKKRLNLTLPSDLETLLKILAKRDNVPLATKAIQLINEAIEMEEDLMLSRIAEERLAEIENGESEVISHEDFLEIGSSRLAYVYNKIRPQSSEERFQEPIKINAFDVKKVIEDKLSQDPCRFGKPLRNTLKNTRSLRVGKYRIVYEIKNNELIVLVLKIGNRGKVYKEVEKRMK